MILVLGSNEDPHIDRVCSYLDYHEAHYSIIFTSEFPNVDVASMRFSDDGCTGNYRHGSDNISFDDIDVVWFRRLFPPTLHSSITEDEGRTFGMGEARAFLVGLWAVLSDKKWINSYHCTQVAESKPYQLSLAKQVGLEIPRTLITNDLKQVEQFIDEAKGDVIYKPLTAYATTAAYVDGKVKPSQCVYTNIIDQSVLERFGAQISGTPCLFQDYVPKKVELRITIVGNRFYAAAIHSQQSKRSTRIDWRHYDLENTPHVPFELPKEVKTKLRDLLDSLGLVYGAVDCVVTPDNRIVFLEVNPGGQWLWIEELTGLRIGQGIAEELILHTKAQAGQTEKAW